MWVRATAILLAMSCAVTQAEAAGRSSSRAPVRPVAVDASRTLVQTDPEVRMDNWRASRWSLGNTPASYGESTNRELQIRWKLNKIKIRAPINFSLN